MPQQEKMNGKRSAEPAARYRVLVVDDYAEGCTTVCVALQALGHVALGANTGTSGLALAQEKRPEIALVDIWLPDMDGNEVARALRSRAGLPD